jgi:hypothetical protein
MNGTAGAGPFPGRRPGEQKRPAGILTKLTAEKWREEDIIQHDGLRGVNIHIREEVQMEGVRIRTAQHDPIVVVQHLRLYPRLRFVSVREEEAEKSIHPPAETGVNDDPRISQLVPE